MLLVNYLFNTGKLPDNRCNTFLLQVVVGKTEVMIAKETPIGREGRGVC